jgi:hypothetical protein
VGGEWWREPAQSAGARVGRCLPRLEGAGRIETSRSFSPARPAHLNPDHALLPRQLHFHRLPNHHLPAARRGLVQARRRAALPRHSLDRDYPQLHRRAAAREQARQADEGLDVEVDRRRDGLAGRGVRACLTGAQHPVFNRHPTTKRQSAATRSTDHADSEAGGCGHGQHAAGEPLQNSQRPRGARTSSTRSS